MGTDLANDQRRYWDRVAGDKIFTTPMQTALFGQYVDRSARVLDFGCGYGRTLTELHELGYRDLWGIDSSSQMVRLAREQCPYASLHVREEEHLPFAEGSFDAVLVLAVLTCIVRDNEQDLLMTELVRVLKKGGLIYINDYLLNNDERNLSRYQRYEKEYGAYGVFELPEGALVRHYSEKRVDELVGPFTSIAREEVVYTTMNGNRSRGYFFLGRHRARDILPARYT